MRPWFPRTLLVLLVSLMVWGCGRESPESDLGPLLEFDEGSRGTPVPYSLELGRYTHSGQRFEFPAVVVEPTPAPTRRPTPDHARVLVEVEPTPTSPPPVIDLGVDTCEGHFRVMLIEYEGRKVFGPALVHELSDLLLEERPDCRELGWAPEFGLEPVCVGHLLGDEEISQSLLHFGRYDREGRARPTMRDSLGNILVHFERVPLDDIQGCWFYNSFQRSWTWAVSDGRIGVDYPRFPGCEEPLRGWVEEFSPGSGPDVRQVARKVDEIRLLVDGCGTELWNPYPVDQTHADCALQGEFGVRDDRSILISWHPDFPPSDRSVCWHLLPGSDGWGFSIIREDEGPEDEEPGSDVIFLPEFVPEFVPFGTPRVPVEPTRDPSDVAGG